MRVSIRLTLALCLIAATFIGALSALRVWQTSSIQSIMDEHREMAGRLADNALQLLERPLRDCVQDYTIWSELVTFVDTADPAWAAENLQLSLQTYDMDAVWVLRGNFSPVYFSTRLGTQSFDSLLPKREDMERLFRGGADVHFFLDAPQGLMEVRGATIHPSSDVDRKTPPAGCLLMGKLWDADHLQRLEDLLNGVVRLQFQENGQFAPQDIPQHAQTLVLYKPMEGWDGQPVARLEIHTHAPVTENFFGQFNSAIIAAALLALALVCMLAAMLAKWVAMPLRAISAALTGADPEPLGALQYSRTEFGTIARLVAAHFEQRRTMQRDMADRRRFEEVQSFLIHCGQNSAQRDFFQSLASFLAQTLEMDFVCVDRLLPDGLMAQTVAVWYDGRFEDNMSYALHETPCGDVVGKTVCCFPKDVRNLFPQDAVLQEMRAESYVGTTLWGADGRTIGLIAVIGRTPMADPYFAESVLQLVAVRAAAELERRDAEDALLDSREQLRAVLDSGFDAFFLLRNVRDENGTIQDFEIVEVSANGALLVERSRDELVGQRLCELFPFHKTEGFFEKYRRVAEEGSTLDEEVLVRAHPEHGVHYDLWLHHNIVPIRDGIAIASSVINERKQAEAELRESEARFRAISEYSHNAICFIDESARITWCNPRVTDITGYPEEQILAAPTFEPFVAPRSLPFVMENFARFVAGLPYQHEYRFSIVRADGEERLIEKHMTDYADSSGRRTLIASMLDITERFRAENALRESEERFASAFAHAPAGMAIVSLEGRWLKTNTAACAMLGYTEEELRGMRFHNVTLPEDLDADLAQVQALLDCKAVSYTMEKRYIHKQGRIIWALLSVSLVRDAQGNPSYFISQILDITPRRLAEEALRQSEAFSREIQKIARLGGWKVNPHTDYLEWTEGVYDIIEEPRGYRPGLVEGLKYYLPEFQPLLRDSIANCIETGAPFALECEVVTATGKHLWTEVRGLAHVTEGEHSYVMGTFQDITERRRAEEELRYRENLLRKLFEILPVGLWFADGTGRLLMGNTAGQRIWGGEPLVGIEQYGVFRGRRMPSGQEIAPDDWALNHTIREGVTILDEEIEIDALDGKKRTILNYSAPVLGENGAIEAAVVVNLDISDRKRAEEAWRASQARYRSLFDSAKDGILILEAPSGRILDANPAISAMMGLPHADLVGRRFWELAAFKKIAPSRRQFDRLEESDCGRR